MENSTTVIWSPLANDTFVELIDQLVLKWSEKVASDFYDKVRTIISNIKKNNHLCPQSKITGYRKCIINKHNSLVYRINGDTIEIIAFLYNKSDHGF